MGAWRRGLGAPGPRRHTSIVPGGTVGDTGAFGSLLPRAKSARDETAGWHRLRQQLASSLASRTLLNPQKGLGLQGRPCSRRKRTKLNSPWSPFQAADSCGSETQLRISTPGQARRGQSALPGGPGGQSHTSGRGRGWGPPLEALPRPGQGWHRAGSGPSVDTPARPQPALRGTASGDPFSLLLLSGETRGAPQVLPHRAPGPRAEPRWNSRHEGQLGGAFRGRRRRRWCRPRRSSAPPRPVVSASGTPPYCPVVPTLLAACPAPRRRPSSQAEGGRNPRLSDLGGCAFSCRILGRFRLVSALLGCGGRGCVWG